MKIQSVTIPWDEKLDVTFQTNELENSVLNPIKICILGRRTSIGR